MSIRGRLILCMAVGLISFLPGLVPESGAIESGNYTLGARLGNSFSDDEGDFEQYDLFLAYKLPWTTELFADWQLEPMVDLTLSVLDGGDETGGKLAGSFELFLFSPGRSVSLMAGLGAGLLQEEVYGEVDFGGPLFFVFRAGASYWFSPSFSMGYRYNHQSNGSLYDKNPSMNMHQLELRLHF